MRLTRNKRKGVDTTKGVVHLPVLHVQPWQFLVLSGRIRFPDILTCFVLIFCQVLGRFTENSSKTSAAISALYYPETFALLLSGYGVAKREKVRIGKIP